MTKTELSIQIAIVLVVAHVLVVGFLLYAFLAGNFSGDEVKLTLAVIGPTLAAYGSLGAAYITRNHEAERPAGPKMSRAFIFLSWFVVSVLVGALSLTIFLQNAFRFLPQDYAVALGMIEAGFGVYVAQLTKELFSPAAAG